MYLPPQDTRSLTLLPWWLPQAELNLSRVFHNFLRFSPRVFQPHCQGFPILLVHQGGEAGSGLEYKEFQCQVEMVVKEMMIHNNGSKNCAFWILTHFLNKTAGSPCFSAMVWKTQQWGHSFHPWRSSKSSSHCLRSSPCPPCCSSKSSSRCLSSKFSRRATHHRRLETPSQPGNKRIWKQSLDWNLMMTWSRKHFTLDSLLDTRCLCVWCP